MLRLILAALLLLLTASKLLQVVSLTRHGARYHLNDYYDGNSTRSMWGELTPVGMRQHYNLGQILRKQYVDKLQFLNPSYNHSQITIMSTRVPRAIASAISQLNGVYPLGTGRKIPDGINASLLVAPFIYKQDVLNGSIYGLPEGREVFPIKVDGLMQECQKTAEWQARIVKEEKATIDEMNLRYGPLLNKLNRVFNISTPFNVVNMSDLYDTLNVDRFLNRPLPAEITDADFNNLRHLIYYTYSLKLGKDLGRAIATNKINIITSTYDNRIKNPTNPLKWTFLSGHDTDIFPMLTNLNITSYECIEEQFRFNRTTALNCEVGPEFAASMIFELHEKEDTKENVIKIRYNGKYVYLCQQKSTECNYEQWKKRVKPILIDVASICGPQTVSLHEEIIQ